MIIKRPEVGQKFYRVTIDDRYIESFFYVGWNPKVDGHIIAVHGEAYGKVSSIKLEDTNTTFYTSDYREASEKYIEFKEKDLQQAKDIYLSEL